MVKVNYSLKMANFSFCLRMYVYIYVCIYIYVCTYVSGVGTLEISGGIYNTAGFLQRDSWRKDTNIITSKTQALGSLA